MRSGVTHPVEKLSPPSETGESKFRNTLIFSIVSSWSGMRSPEGMRWTRRRASYLFDLAGQRLDWRYIYEHRLTISASSCSLKMSRVVRRVPLIIVGSSDMVCVRHTQATNNKCSAIYGV